MASRATVTVEPQQHIAPHIKKVKIKADMDFDKCSRPNDIHIFYQRLSAFRGGKWTKVAETAYFTGDMPIPYRMQFDKPEEAGTYDIRVAFTQDGKLIKDGERTGQFFVDE